MKLATLTVVSLCIAASNMTLSTQANAQSTSSYCIVSAYQNGEQRFENSCGHGVNAHWYSDGAKRSWHFPPGRSYRMGNGFATAFRLVCRAEGERAVWSGNTPIRCEKVNY